MTAPFQPSVLKALAERVVYPHLMGGPQDEQIYAEDLMESYGSSMPFLMNEEWDELAELTQKWNNKQIQEDESYREYSRRQELYDELMGKLVEMPTYDVVEQKLGTEEAESYLIQQEEIENDPVLNGAFDFTNRFTSKVQIEKLLALFSIVADGLGDKEVIIDGYEQYKRARSREDRERRERLRTINEPLIKKIKEIKLWFPRPKDHALWLQHPQTRDRAAHFLELVEQVRSLMKKHHCVLQHIPKRKLSSSAIGELDNNMQALSAYLMQASS